MASTLRWTPAASAAFSDLQEQAQRALRTRQRAKASKSSQPEGLFKQVIKCLDLLTENPRHPDLRTHEYHSLEHPYERDGKVFEAYVQNRTPGAYRVFWCYGPQTRQITIIAITPHP